MTFTIQGTEYRLHFRHIKHMPPKVAGDPMRWEPSLRAHITLTGITLATIVTPTLIAQGYALCAYGDTYNKEKGRVEALRRAIDSCKQLHHVAPELFAAYRARIRSIPVVRATTPPAAHFYTAWRHDTCGTINKYPVARADFHSRHYCQSCNAYKPRAEFTPVPETLHAGA